MILHKPEMNNILYQAIIQSQIKTKRKVIQWEAI